MSRPRSYDLSTFDEIAVHAIAAEGHRPEKRPHPVDMVEIVRRMARAGYSDGQIAYRTHYWIRSVIRIRAKHNISPGLPFGSNASQKRFSAPFRAAEAG